MQPCYLAVDIGASSGRHIVCTPVEGKMVLTEVYRFENGLEERGGHLCWRLEALVQNVIRGMAACRQAGYLPVSMGIDTWAVDFVLLDETGAVLGDTVAYRDSRTEGMKEKVEALVPFEELYARTGIQYQPFNSVYQLMALRESDPDLLDRAKHFLMIPDYLNYRLTGRMANEYTNATTTALVNAHTKDWDSELIERLGLPRGIFLPIQTPGTLLGGLTPAVQQAVGFDCRVILPATHDTGSAFLAVPARDEQAVTLSSGTWSLLGVENLQPITTAQSCAANFTNEGGYQYRYRYLKNIMGLWMLQNVRREAAAPDGTLPSFPQLCAAAQSCSSFSSAVDTSHHSFLAPASMTQAVAEACRRTGQPQPACLGETVRCIYNSLSRDYAGAIAQLQALTGRQFTSLNIVGGGSQDMTLNQLTANATGLTVYAGPTEGTALGNLMVQMLADGVYPDLQAARNALFDSFEIKEIAPCL